MIYVYIFSPFWYMSIFSPPFDICLYFLPLLIYVYIFSPLLLYVYIFVALYIILHIESEWQTIIFKCLQISVIYIIFNNCNLYVFQTVIALLMLIPGDVGSLIDFFSFAAWLFYALAIVCLFILRWKMKDVHRPIKVLQRETYRIYS